MLKFLQDDVDVLENYSHFNLEMVINDTLLDMVEYSQEVEQFDIYNYNHRELLFTKLSNNIHNYLINGYLN